MAAPRILTCMLLTLLVSRMPGAYARKNMLSFRSSPQAFIDLDYLPGTTRNELERSIRQEKDINPIDAVLQPVLDDESTGLSVIVSVGDEIVKEEAYGLANVENNLPLTTDSRTNIASVSKQFTGFLLALMQSRGLLSLDDDVRKYVPEMPDYGTTVTLRHMIHMSSGIRDIFIILQLGGNSVLEPIPRERLIKLIASQDRLRFTPGERWEYSNSNYVLLAWIIEKVSGIPFPELLRTEIFSPLGMLDTTVYDDPTRVYKNLTQSYALEALSPVIGEAPSYELRNSKWFVTTIGTSGIISTPRDVLKWAKNFENSKLEGGQELIDETLVPYVLPSNESDTTYALGAQYAMGNIIQHIGNLTIIWHNGAIQGFRSILIRVPQLKTIINLQGTSTALANNIVQLGFQIIEAVHPGALTSSLGSGDEGSEEDMNTPVQSEEPDESSNFLGDPDVESEEGMTDPDPSAEYNESYEDSKKMASLEPGAYGQKAGVWTIAGPPASYFDMTSNCTGQVGAKRSCSLLINLGIFSKAYLHPEEELVWTGRILGVNGGITVTFDSADPHTASIKVKVPDVKPFEAVAVRDPKLQLTSEQLSKYEGQFYSEEVDAVYKARQDGYGLSFDVDAGIVDQPAYLPCCAESHFNGTFVESRPKLFTEENFGVSPIIILQFSPSSDTIEMSVENSAPRSNVQDVSFKRIDSCVA